MTLATFDEILKEFPDLTDEKRHLAEKLYAALSGDVVRDTLHNHGKPMTAEAQDDFTKKFDEFMSRPENRALLIKD